MLVRARTTLLAPALVVAVLVAGCGDDGESADATETTSAAASEDVAEETATTPSETTPDVSGGEAEAAVDTVRTFIRATLEGDGASACDQLTKAGQQSFIAPFEELQQGITCEDVVAFIVEASKNEEPSFEANGEEIPLTELDSWPFEVTVSDDGTSAVVRSGSSDSNSAELEYEDGQWRISRLVD